MKKLKAWRKWEEAERNRAADAKERERKMARREAEQEAREERDRLLKLKRKVTSAA